MPQAMSKQQDSERDYMALDRGGGIKSQHPLLSWCGLSLEQKMPPLLSPCILINQNLLLAVGQGDPQNLGAAITMKREPV